MAKKKMKRLTDEELKNEFLADFDLMETEEILFAVKSASNGVASLRYSQRYARQLWSLQALYLPEENLIFSFGHLGTLLDKTEGDAPLRLEPDTVYRAFAYPAYNNNADFQSYLIDDVIETHAHVDQLDALIASLKEPHTLETPLGRFHKLAGEEVYHGQIRWAGGWVEVDIMPEHTRSETALDVPFDALAELLDHPERDKELCAAMAAASLDYLTDHLYDTANEPIEEDLARDLRLAYIFVDPEGGMVLNFLGVEDWVPTATFTMSLAPDGKILEAHIE